MSLNREGLHKTQYYGTGRDGAEHGRTGVNVERREQALVGQSGTVGDGRRQRNGTMPHGTVLNRMRWAGQDGKGLDRKGLHLNMRKRTERDATEKIFRDPKYGTRRNLVVSNGAERG